MRQRTVSDLMTHTVVDVAPDATFKDIVETLAEHDITAVPVVDDDRHALGVVSEADLMGYEARQPDPGGHVPDVLRRYADRAPSDTSAANPTARQLMTSPAVVARPGWTVVEAARLMQEYQIKRLPVVSETNQVVGVVSRSDLMRVFLRRDRAIREEIRYDILANTFRMAPTDVTVHVVDGCVTLTGRVQRRSTIPVLVRLCRSVDGVVDVTEELDYALDDDTDPAPAAR